jgi:class 3 adenylate cyclase
MARLSAAERAALPDRAFAYVDAQGRRRLPIVDAAHVRNALARFNQVEFEDDHARDEARRRLLRAAQKFRIVPTGFVTMLMTDIEGSTDLLHRLGDTYGELLTVVRGVQRAAAERVGGCVVEARADEFFAAFESPRGALEAAIAAQRELGGRSWPEAVCVRVRMGMHAGYPTVREANYIGMAVHTTSRIADAAHGGQIVISGDARTALTDMTPAEIAFKALGRHRLRGIPDEQTLFQVTAPGLERRFPHLRV